MGVVSGIFLHFIGAFSASVCYTPQNKTRYWCWQTYWLLQAAVCWLFLPIIIALLTVPQLLQVLQEAPVTAMRNSFFLGAAYGIGGTAFGLAIRYVGFSLTYAISVGISCVLGTLLPSLYEGTLQEVLSGTGAGYIISGITAGAVGIALCGLAGRLKEKDYAAQDMLRTKKFSFSVGITLCILSGILSALYGFSLAQGQPIADVAARYGAGNLQVNVIYLFSNSGAFVTTAIYCIYMHIKQNTFSQYVAPYDQDTIIKRVNRRRLLANYGWAILTGILWFTQFFFYGLAHMQMGAYKFTSWAIHMILLVLISTVIGLWLKEWAAVKVFTRQVLLAALLILILAVLLLTFGNHLGSV